jgi:hypothetical protein
VAFARLLAPVAAPPPPKPPQLNLVASSLMPDVATDTFAPGGAPQLSMRPAAVATAGWGTSIDPTTTDETGRARRMWHRPPGDTTWRTAVEQWNAVVAAVGVMDDVELKQAESDIGVTVDSLPQSVYPSTSKAARWTGGFAYAPENQYPGVLADPCGQRIDLPAVQPPVLAGVNAAGSLASASYDYAVTAVNANGESLPSSTVTVAVTSGGAQLTWTQAGKGNVASWNVYGRTHSATLHLLANVTTRSYLDTGAATPGSQAPPSTDTTAGPGSYGNLAQVQYVPFLIQVEDECSTWGWEVRDFTGRALRLLDNATPNAIERELWAGAFATNTLTGPLAGMNGFLSQSGTSSAGGSGVAAMDLTPGTVPSVTRGIQILEDYLANTGFGGQGMLHVAPETSPNLLGARRVGALLLSVMDNIIVPGSGYPTSGATGPAGNANATPPAGQQWIYATDLVSVRLDDPVVYPSTLAEALDRGGFGSPNTIRFRAQRFAAATWDQFRLAACRVSLSS